MFYLATGARSLRVIESDLEESYKHAKNERRTFMGLTLGMLYFSTSILVHGFTNCSVGRFTIF
jgi:hypothetical protein